MLIFLRIPNGAKAESLLFQEEKELPKVSEIACRTKVFHARKLGSTAFMGGPSMRETGELMLVAYFNFRDLGY